MSRIANPAGVGFAILDKGIFGFAILDMGSSQGRFHNFRRDDSDDDDDDDDPILTEIPFKKKKYFHDNADPELIRTGSVKCSRLSDGNIYPLQSKFSLSPLSGMSNRKSPLEKHISFKRSHLEVSPKIGIKNICNKENASSFQSKFFTEPDIEYVGTTTRVPTPFPSKYLGRVPKNGIEREEELGSSSLLSSFKFSPSVTSTVDRSPSGLGIIKRRPIKSSISSSQKLLGLSPTKSGVQKKSAEISRLGKRFRDVIIPSGIRRFMTPRESFRLEDKERYRQLLQQYTSSDVLFRNTHKKSLLTTSAVSKFSATDIASITGAIIKTHLDPLTTTKSRLKLEKNEDFPMPSLSLPHTSPTLRVSSSEEKDSPCCPITVIDLEPLKPTNDHTQDDDDDDIIIMKEIKPSKPIRNSLEDKLQMSLFYNDDWLKDIRQYYNDKQNETNADVQVISETKRLCEESRKECEKDLLEKVAKRISQLDIKYPNRVTELTDKAEEEFPELTPEMETMIERAFKGGSLGQVLADKFNIKITRRDLHTLAGLNWLNDEVINFYMNMLVERGRNDNYPSVYAFNTFFYSKLAKMGYGSVRRWTKKVNIFSNDLLLVPVHLGMHWCLATIDFRSKSIRYYDSMLGDNQKCLSELKKYLDSEHQDKKKSHFDVTTFITQNVKDIPQQMNGSDCGMFSCKFAECLSRDGQITFTQEHMPYFRRRMVYEIVTRRLM